MPLADFKAGDGGRFKFDDHMDRPLIIEVRKFETGLKPYRVDPNDPDATRSRCVVDIVSLRQPHGPAAYDDVHVWQAFHLGLKPYVGGDPIPTKVTWGKAASGNQIMRLMSTEDLSAADIKLAEAYRAEHGDDPFKAKPKAARSWTLENPEALLNLE